MNESRAKALVFLKTGGAPSREAVCKAVADLDEEPVLRGEGERGPDVVVRIDEDSRVAIVLEAEPAAKELYEEHLEASGFDDAEVRTVRAHGSHARCLYLESEGMVEPADRLGSVYKVAARLCAMDGVGVLSPDSGVIALGLRPEHVDGRIDDDVPPLDLWIQVEMKDEDTARSVGAHLVGANDVVLRGIKGMAPDLIFDSVLGAVAYLERIRRELVPGEELRIGNQPWAWMTIKSKNADVILRRQQPDA